MTQVSEENGTKDVDVTQEEPLLVVFLAPLCTSFPFRVLASFV